MRIFIHHVDTYLGKALVKELRRTQHDGMYHRLFGTVAGYREDAPSVVKKIFSHDDAKHAKQMEAKIQTCKLCVIDLFHATLEDLHFLLRCLKVDPETGRPIGSEPLPNEVMLVLVSSVMTWAGTEGTGELTEGDYKKRVPAPGFEKWKEMEDLVMDSFNKEGSMVRAFVLAAGILYGQGEDTWNKCFEDAFLCKQQHKIIAPGTNCIPSVHVTDMARLLKQLAFLADVTPAEKPYLIAVDQAKLTQAQIVQGVVDEMCEPYTVPIVEDVPEAVAEGEEIDEAALEEKEVHKRKMTLNLKMAPSSLMMGEEGPGAFGHSSNPPGWVAKDGIVASIKATAKEFCKERLLQPMRVLISGPPGSGKSTLARGIAEHFNIPHLEMPGADETHALEQLNANVCRYRGYVLDAYPCNYQECDKLFMHEKEIVLDEGEVNEEGGEGPKTERVPNEELCPEFVFVLQAPTELCLKRKAANAGGKCDTGESDEAFLKRTTDYEDANLKMPVMTVMPDKSLADQARDAAKKAAHDAREAVLAQASQEEGEGGAGDAEAEAAAAASKAYDDYIAKAFGKDAQEDTKSLTDFFQDVAGKGVFPMQVTDSQSEASMLESARIFMENTTKPNNKKGRPYNYLIEEEEVVDGIMKKRQEEEEALEKARAEAEEAARQETSGKKEEEKREAERARIIAEYERQRAVIQGMPLREYLMQYMVPSLTEGLIEVCKVLPEDPVDYLANYLETHAAQLDD